MRDEQVDDFIVRDSSGAALIRGRRACVVAIPAAVLAHDDERKRRWLRRRHARTHFLGVLERTFSFFETTLTPGAEVTVLGRCVERSGGGDGPYREQSDVTITLDAPERGSVIVEW